MKWLSLIFVALLGLVFTVLGMHNSGPVEVDYLFGKSQLALISVMVLSFICGALLTLFVFGVKSVFWRCRARRLGKQLKAEHSAQSEAQIRAEFQADNAK